MTSRITVVGGGLGGLTTARVLQVHGIETVIYEAEPDRNSRVQGGMLDIHQESGQRALHAAELFEQFTARVHHGGEAMRVLDRYGTVHRDEPDRGTMERPEIDRGDLRDILIDSLAPGTIRWGHKLTGAHRESDGRFRLEFADAATEFADVVIGADGAWSRIRPLVSDSVPAYTGISFVEGDLADGSRRYPAQATAMGAGMLFALGGDNAILGHRESDASLHFYFGHRADESWLDTIDFSDTGTAKRALLELLPDWDDALRGLIANADGPLVPRRIHALPVGHSWPHQPGVTLLGDAAHLMSPFAGEGANLAMHDGAELALALAGEPDDVDAALGAYETDLFARAAASARESAEGLELIFAADAPRGIVEQFAAFDAQERDPA